MKPTEIRLVAGLLDRDYENAETAAETVIRALDEKRAKEDRWVGVALIPIGDAWYRFATPPQSTKLRAEKQAASWAAPGPECGSFFAARIKNEGDPR